MRRIGAARVVLDVALYKIIKSDIEGVLSDFRAIKQKLAKRAYEEADALMKARLKVVEEKSSHLYGAGFNMKVAHQKIREASKLLANRRLHF